MPFLPLRNQGNFYALAILKPLINFMLEQSSFVILPIAGALYPSQQVHVAGSGVLYMILVSVLILSIFPGPIGINIFLSTLIFVTIPEESLHF